MASSMVVGAAPRPSIFSQLIRAMKAANTMDATVSFVLRFCVSVFLLCFKDVVFLELCASEILCFWDSLRFEEKQQRQRKQLLVYEALRY